MMPLNRDDDARRLFTRPPVPFWLKVALVVAMAMWLYAIGLIVKRVML